jgi:transcriptional regulator with XRE-family HTH domain
MNVGEKILRALKMRNMTQKELSEKLGIPMPQLGEFITGYYIPDCVILKEIATLLHVSADYLLDIDFGGECERDELWLVTKFKAFNAEQKHEALAGFRMVESRGRWG